MLRTVNGARTSTHARAQSARSALLLTLVGLVGCSAAHPTAGHSIQTPDRAAGEPAALAGATLDPAGWRTDFSRHSVSLPSIESGGPGRDGIPSIDRPRFVSVAAAARFVTAREPVISGRARGMARAYPIQILIWHEIVNDTLAGVPIAVTYCPLCNSAIAFDRRTGDER